MCLSYDFTSTTWTTIGTEFRNARQQAAVAKIGDDRVTLVHSNDKKMWMVKLEVDPNGDEVISEEMFCTLLMKDLKEMNVFGFVHPARHY